MHFVYMREDNMLIDSSKVLLLAHFLLFIQPDSGLSQSLPLFSLHPFNIITTEGSTVTLRCTLDTTENVTYKWAVNGSVLTLPYGSYSTGQGGQSLTISSITFNMEGNYSCLVSNGNWTLTSKYATVRLQYLSSNSDGGSTTIIVKKNDYVVIDCIPDYESYPEPVTSDFGWIIAGSSTLNDFRNSDNNVDMGSKGNLYLRRVIRTETYTCRLSFNSKTIEHTTIVNISGLINPPPGPLIITQPQSVIVNNGDRVIMNCIGAGTPEPTISWSVPSGSNANIPNSRKFELQISNVGPNDIGNYSCNATGVGNSPIASVSIRAPPSLTTLPPPSPLNITWGDTFTLNCSASGSDLVWAWFHNGIWISSGSSITIENAGLSATGAYQCFVSNLAGNVSIATFVQVQTIPPTFTPNGSLSDQLAFSGRQHTFVCKAIGAPMPTYQWKKDGNPVGTGDTAFDISTPGQLILKSASALLQGNYTCVVKSSIDQIVIGESNTTAHLTVVDPTSITSSHLPSVSIFVGESFTLNCSAGHDTVRTTVEIKWIHNGEIINSTSHTLLKSNGQTDLSLTVNNATTRDQGQYQCVIHTTLINNPHLITPIINSIITYVNITSAPIKPVITELRALTSHIIEVNWKYDGFPGNLNFFKIDTQPGPGVNPNSWVTQITVTGSSSTRKNITNLRPYTLYWVRVVAVLKNEQQVDSLTYESSRTKEYVPSAAPSNVNAITRSKTSLSLHWEAVEESSRNGILIDYTVRYWTNSSRGGGITYYNVSVGSNMTSYGLTGLQADTTYYIAIAAHTRPGMGPFSAPIKGTTDPTIGGTNNQSSNPVYERVWFIFTVSVIGLAILVVIVAIIAAIRWSKKRKGHRYPVRNSFYGEDAGGFSADVVAYYDNRKKVEPIETIFTDGGDSESSQATLQPSFTHATYASSNDGSIRLGIPVPPAYINPPSFEDTLKARMKRRRSASMSLLEKADHLQLTSSGWSIGHDPKQAFYSTDFVRDDNTDSGSIHKARLQGPDEISGDSNDSGLHSQDLSTKNGTLSSFV